MALQYSFYGGKSGSTYHLVQHFNSIKEMVDAFQKGGSYNTVNYGEYVVIDTIVNDNHYNSPQNGIIYRRGLNYLEAFNPNSADLNDNNTIEKNDKNSDGTEKYFDYSTDIDGNTNKVFNAEKFRTAFNLFVTNPGGGAEYVGQIVGPQGTAPQLSLVNWQTFLKEYESGDGEKYSVEYSPTPSATFDDNGDVKQSEIIDVIEYGSVNIKDADGNVKSVIISAEIPSNVFKYHAESIEPYDSGYATYDAQNNIWTYAGLISEDEISKTHPYYWQYGIKVPKGIKGQDLEKIDIELTGKTLNNGDDVDNSDHNYQYYYVTRNYDKTAQGETTKTYIDSYNRTIHKITNNGQMLDFDTIQRSHSYSVGETVVADGLGGGLALRCVRGGTTGGTSPALEGRVIGDTVIDGSVRWQIVSAEVSSPSLITVHYTHGDNDQAQIRTVDYITYDDQTGRLYVKYSDLDNLFYLGENQGILKVDYIKTVEDTDGNSHVIDKLRITYNTYNYVKGNLVVDSDFKYENGQLIYPTTDSTGRNIKYIDEEFRFVDEIYINDKTDLSKSKYFNIRYNDGQVDQLSQPLNEIASIQQYGDSVIVLYSDPAVRKELFDATRDYTIGKNIYKIPGFDTLTADDDGNGNLYWINLASLYHTEHIFGKFDSLEQLQEEYPYGFGRAVKKDADGNIVYGNDGKPVIETVANEKQYAGWVATVEKDQNSSILYAYDYRSQGGGWYKMQDLSASAIDPETYLTVAAPDSTGLKPEGEKDTTLAQGGYWFIMITRED